MIYNTMYMGGVLVHGERAHKYLQKIKTKTGKWRYIYENTLNYKKNKAELHGLESSRDYYRNDAKIYQNDANRNKQKFREYSSLANQYRQAQIRNEKAAKENGNYRRDLYNRAGKYYEQADKAHSRGEYIDALKKGNKEMSIANEYAPSYRDNEQSHKNIANWYGENANSARESASSVRRTAKREENTAKTVKAISDSRSRRAREIKSRLNMSLQEISKKKIQKGKNLLNRLYGSVIESAKSKKLTYIGNERYN